MASVIVHTAVISIVISVAAWSRSTARAPDTSAEPMQLPRLVFLLRPEPGGGGGGGGNRQVQPPSRAKAIGQDRLTVPVRNVSRSDRHLKTTRRLHNRCFSKRNRWHRERS